MTLLIKAGGEGSDPRLPCLSEGGVNPAQQGLLPEGGGGGGGVILLSKAPLPEVGGGGGGG